MCDDCQCQSSKTQRCSRYISVVIVSALVYDRARLLLLFNLSLFLSFELSR